MQIQPYLFFDGRCAAAVEFYQRALGAKVSLLMRYKDSPEPPPPGKVPPNWDDKVMHVSMQIGNATVMASDGCGADGVSHNGFSLSLNLNDATTADRAFHALAAGGKIEMPLSKTFWSPRFGMLTDKFGIQWMVNVVAAPPP